MFLCFLLSILLIVFCGCSRHLHVCSASLSILLIVFIYRILAELASEIASTFNSFDCIPWQVSYLRRKPPYSPFNSFDCILVQSVSVALNNTMYLSILLIVFITMNGSSCIIMFIILSILLIVFSSYNIEIWLALILCFQFF